MNVEALKIIGESRAGETRDDQSEPYGQPQPILPEISVGGKVFAMTKGMNLERALRIVEGAKAEAADANQTSNGTGA